MRRWNYAAAAAAATMLIAQPCLAASEIRGDGATDRRSGAFAGVRLRLPIGMGNPERPSARMQLTTFHDYRNAAGATVRSFRADGVEFGVDDRGRASLMVAGQDVARRDDQMVLNASTKTYLIIGGVVVAVLVLALVAASSVPPSVDFDD
jgi:hypothetical protein